MSNRLLKVGTDQALGMLGKRYMKVATAALPRVHDPEDSEGLHDFRVALRRLRSVLRTYRADLHSGFDKPLYRQLGDLARRTNVARDTEVMLAWLESEIPHLTTAQKRGARWWHEQLANRFSESYATLENHLDEDFAAIAKPFKKWFRRMGKAAKEEHGFAHVTADKLIGELEELTLLLTVVHSIDDMPTLHEARIVGKRLRYLMDPLIRGCPPCKSAARALKDFQELLGGLHDCHVRDLALQQAGADAAAEWARQRIAMIADGARPDAGGCRELTGLAALAVRNRAETESLFARFSSEHLQNDAADIAELIVDCIHTLADDGQAGHK